MDDEMIERCAKSLWDNDQDGPYIRYGFSNKILFGKDGPITWEEINTEDVSLNIAQEWRDKAILVIKAMREPTEKMLKAENVHIKCFTCGGSVEGYQAMIDSIIND